MDDLCTQFLLADDRHALTGFQVTLLDMRGLKDKWKVLVRQYALVLSRCWMLTDMEATSETKGNIPSSLVQVEESGSGRHEVSLMKASLSITFNRSL